MINAMRTLALDFLFEELGKKGNPPADLEKWYQVLGSGLRVEGSAVLTMTTVNHTCALCEHRDFLYLKCKAFPWGIPSLN